MVCFVLVEFLRLALALVGTDEILQRSFAVGNGRLYLAYFLFQLVDAIFHLLAPDRGEAFRFRLSRNRGIGMTSSGGYGRCGRLGGGRRCCRGRAVSRVCSGNVI